MTAGASRMTSKDEEVAQVVTDLTALLDKLQGNVDALHAILLPPPSPPDVPPATGKELTPS